MTPENRQTDIKTSYLYGSFSNDELAVIAQQNQALLLKISKAKILLEQLLDVPAKIRDWIRINKITEAIEFNKQLIEETNMLVRTQANPGFAYNNPKSNE